jgi:hypothetical protein
MGTVGQGSMKSLLSAVGAAEPAATAQGGSSSSLVSDIELEEASCLGEASQQMPEYMRRFVQEFEACYEEVDGKHFLKIVVAPVFV